MVREAISVALGHQLEVLSYGSPRTALQESKAWVLGS